MMQPSDTLVLPLELVISSAAVNSFATLLQGGISLPAASGIPVGIFLNTLPGFDEKYITETIQTIFLDGNAIDDLQRPLTQTNHILALSAAMPGLAGAIFRRNSLCAALRTQKDTSQPAPDQTQKIMVLLKLFNSIALEKGAGLLAKGGIFSGETLHSFFEQRPKLHQDVISLRLDGQSLSPDHLSACIDMDKRYFLGIKQSGQEVSR